MLPHWFILNKRKILPIALGLLLLLALVWWAVASIGDSGLYSGEENFNFALQKTLSSSSYRYSVEIRQEGKDIISRVEGQRVEPDRIHITGTMQKTKMEFIQIGAETYMKDSWSDRWVALQGNSMAQSDLFVTEFNPLALFNFKDIPIIKNVGKEKVDGAKTVVYEMSPMVQNPFWEMKYVDFKYKVWVETATNYILKAQAVARLPGGKTGLVVDMKFWDYNTRIDIERPIMVR